MTTTLPPTPTNQLSQRLATHLVNGLLAVKPLASFAKHQARSMMIRRAESIGVYWRQEVQTLRSRQHTTRSPHELAPEWAAELELVRSPDLVYPSYYLTSFHAYAEGNLGWQPALEVEVAAQAVHARLFPEAGAQGDARLRQSYHTILQQQLPAAPKDILDIGCSVGMSTFALQQCYPDAALTGVDLSPYFLAIAHYRDQQRIQPALTETPPLRPIRWVHAAAEQTGLPDASFDLVSAFLIFHELPQSAAIAILHEARRLLRPGGHLAIMEMNPQSQAYAKMPPYILTLLKSTEPYLDEYFGLDLAQEIYQAGFTYPTQQCNSPRHRTVIAQTR
ncbi:MAG: class I SAM-dependent methyltransferase [Synechococcales bacterium]|nr:class I SAM-dependent methyltransferase [Synechococcales bacterium]